MSEQPKGGGPAFNCAWCDRPRHIRQGRIWLCEIHYRISSMRSRAKRDGKYVPTRHEIEALATDMTCCGCGKQMHWLRSFGASLQVTLQHDRSGAIRLLCLGCNTRHSVHPGDEFYVVLSGQKRCPDCGQTLPASSFARDMSRPIGLKTYCRDCSSIRHKNWRASHAYQITV